MGEKNIFHRLKKTLPTKEEFSFTTTTSEGNLYHFDWPELQLIEKVL